MNYDERALSNFGIALARIEHDTLLESYVLESHRHYDLDSLAQRLLNVTTLQYTDVCGKGAAQIGFAAAPIDKATEYAAEDADLTLQLHCILYPRLAEEKGLE